MVKRLSSHNLDLVIKKATLAQMLGYKIERPVYADWFWRGYSVLIRDEQEVVND